MNSHNFLQDAQPTFLTRSKPMEQVSGLQRSWEQPEVAELIKKKIEPPKPIKPLGTYTIIKRRGAK